jgi:competence protein ComEC
MRLLPILILALAAGIAIRCPVVALPAALLSLTGRLRFLRLPALAFALGGLVPTPVGDGTLLALYPEGARLLRLRGTVVEGPDRPHGGSARFRLRTREAAGKPASGDVRVYLPDGSFLPPAGTEIEVLGPLLIPRGPGNPGETSPRAALREAGITHILPVRSPECMTIVAPAPPLAPRRLIHASRTALDSSILSRCRPPADALLSSLILGRSELLDEVVQDDFRRTGTYHVLAISGLHVALLCAVFWFLLRALPLPRGVAGLILAFVALFYAALTGFRPPAARAALGVTAWAAASLFRRKVRALPAISLVAAAILIPDPRAIDSPGFQLSFAAVLGIMTLARKLKAGLFARTLLLDRFTVPRRRPLHLLLIYLSRGVPVTLAATFATAPLLLWHFGSISLVVLPANLVVVPLTAVLVPLGFACALIGFFPPAELLAGAVLATVRALSAVPCAALCLPAPPLAAALAYAVGLLFAAARPSLGRRAALLLTAGLAALAASGPLLRRAPPEPRLTILSVGHGACAVLETPEGAVAVFDAGSQRPRAFAYAILPFLRHRRISAIDLLVLSHDDTDHVNAARALLRALPVRDVRLPDRFHRGDRIALPGADIEVLWPPPGTGLSDNDRSAVVRVRAGGLSALLPGDIEGPGLERLLATGADLRVDLLVLPHHGRPDPASPLLLAATAPRVVVASSGPEDPLDPVFVGALRTDRWGAVTVLPGGRATTFLSP